MRAASPAWISAGRPDTCGAGPESDPVWVIKLPGPGSFCHSIMPTMDMMPRRPIQTMMNYMNKADMFCSYKLTKAPFPLRPQAAPQLPIPKQSQSLRVARPMSHMLHQSRAHTSAYAVPISRISHPTQSISFAVQPAMAAGALATVLGMLLFLASLENPLYADGITRDEVTPMTAAALWMGHARRTQPESDKVQLMKDLAQIGPL